MKTGELTLQLSELL